MKKSASSANSDGATNRSKSSDSTDRGVSDSRASRPVRSKAHASRRGKRRPGHGAVAIIVEDAKFLVIRRSAIVRAPNLLCFAGGTIEKGETPEQAIVRELQEELNLVANAVEHVWQSRTGWGTLLEWVLVERTSNAEPIANPDEVAEWMWLSGQDLLQHPKLLPSVPAFYKAWAAKEFELPQRAGTPDPNWADL